MDIKEYIHIMKNTITDTQYMTKQRQEKFLKDIGEDKPIENLLNSDSERILGELEKYEYFKNYKFFTLHKFDISKIDISKLKKSSFINKDKYDDIKSNIGKPTLKEYDDKNIDLKFSVLIDGNYKYVVIVSIFLDIGIIAIKYCAIESEYYSNNMYITIKNRVKLYLKENLNIVLEDIDTKRTFKKFYADIKSGIADEELSLYNAHFYDDLNGSCSVKATDDDKLPFLQTLDELAEKFKDEEDKKILKKFVKDYEENSIMRKMAIKWKRKFSNNKGQKGNIIVGVREIYIENKHTNKLKLDCIRHNIIQNESVNKERIDYVIRYIAKNIEYDEK
ncbi:hypothetical protein [Clostridium baratii]|uniref:hypothetical protein n=1 Tax=Clostridium baratii TaxID=1561 RepID=UPI00294222AB|nr:hypothetical protein [Clostridium baratii]